MYTCNYHGSISSASDDTFIMNEFSQHVLHVCVCMCLFVFVFARMCMCVYKCADVRVPIIRLHDDRAVKQKSNGVTGFRTHLETAIAGQFVYRARVLAAFLMDAPRLSSKASVGHSA